MADKITAATTDLMTTMIRMSDRRRREDEPNGCSIRSSGRDAESAKHWERNTGRAFSQMGINAKIGHVTEMEDIVSCGAMQTSCLVFDKEVVSAGEVLGTDRIRELIEVYGEGFERGCSRNSIWGSAGNLTM